MFILAVVFFTECNKKAIPTAKKNKPETSEKAKPAVKPATVKKSENFDVFYQRFHKDSLFQISRVQFPLKGQQISMKGAKSWKKENWIMIKAKAGEIDRSQFNVKTVKKDDSYFEGIYCKNCVFSFEMEYRLISGKWYLVYLQEKDE